MKAIQTVYLSVVFLFAIHPLIAQDTLFYQPQMVEDTTPAIRTISTYDNNGVTLRWAPGDPTTWIQLNALGYKIHRHQLNADGLPIPGSKREFVVRKWDIEAFRPWVEKENNYVLAAAQCLYGTSEAGSAAGFNMQGRYEELNNRFGIALLSADIDPSAADALGLRLRDDEVVPNQLYLYQVYPADTALQILHGPSIVVTQVNPAVIPLLDHVVEGEGHVILKWSRPLHEDAFSAYQIEVSLDNQRFTPLTTLPFVGGESNEYPSEYFAYRHNIANYQPRYYRVLGLSPFGTLSSPSTSVRAQAKDKTPPGLPSQIRLHCDAITDSVHIEWKIPGDADFKSTVIFRSLQYDGQFTQITTKALPPNVIHFKEKAVNTRAITYYKVATVDTAGNMQFSRILQAAFRDTVAPATPTGLKGMVDSLGIVRLTWNHVKDSDLAGYQIYMANQEDHFFTNNTPRPISDNRYTDTISLKTFTEEIFYRVAAVDFHSHVSEWSEPLKISKPDTIRPMPPSFAGYRVEKDHILLRTIPSRSKDIVSHILFKRQLPKKDWVEVKAFKMETESFQDFDVTPDEVYEYKFISVDDSGLVCLEPAMIRIKCIDRSRPEAPEILVCRKEEAMIRLEWAAPDKLTKQLVIYRSINNGPFTTIAQVEHSNSYADLDVMHTKSYAYKIKSIWEDGQKSAFSNEVSPQEN